MKALVFHGAFDLRLEEIERPNVEPSEVLIKVAAVAMCGSDVHGYAGKTGRRTPGTVMGHEVAGVIEAVGRDVKDRQVGQKVAVQPILYCGRCELCRAGHTSICPHKKMVGITMGHVGGLSEYMAIPASRAFPLPPDLPLNLGALVEPFAVGAGAVEKALPVRDQTVLIVGSGVIGLTVLLMLRERSPRKVFIVDKDERKLKIAERHGAVPINLSKTDPVECLLAKTDGRGADVAFEAVGVTASVQTAMYGARTGGRVIWVGNSQKTIEVDMQDVVVRGKSIQGIYCYSDSNFQEAIDFIAGHRAIAQEFVEQEIPPAQAPALFEQLARGQKELLRGVIRFE